MGFYKNQAIEKAGKSSKERKKSKFATSDTDVKFEGDVTKVNAELFKAAVLGVLSEGACVSFAGTKDGECLVVSVLDGSDRVKQYLRSETAVIKEFCRLGDLKQADWLGTF